MIYPSTVTSFSCALYIFDFLLVRCAEMGERLWRLTCFHGKICVCIRATQYGDYTFVAQLWGIKI